MITSYSNTNKGITVFLVAFGFKPENLGMWQGLTNHHFA